MNALLKWLLLTASLGLAGAAAADADCQLQLSPDLADYGRLQRAAILGTPAAGGGFSLGKRLTTLSVACRRPVALTLFLRGPADGAGHYRFGSQGQLALTLSQASVDGRPVTLGTVDAAAQVQAQSGPSLAWQAGKGIAPMAGAQPAVGRRFALQIEVEASLPAEALAVRNEAPFESRHIIEAIPH